MIHKRRVLASLIAAACLIPPTVSADEPTARSPYYEDDAWYDISEWFDGNDYNPTDEALGRWDDEIYQASDAATSNDSNSDRPRESYGYRSDTTDDNRWFFDYYDDGSGYWSKYEGWNTYTVYSDTDQDGQYDTYSYYNDSDGDGKYEDFDRYRFGEADNQHPIVSQSYESNTEKVVGVVEKTKMVNVRGQVHLVAEVRGKDDKSVTVDLGPQQADTQLFEGQTLTVEGRRIQVGDKSLLLATLAKSNDAEVSIDRAGRRYQGEIVSTHHATIRGQQHLMAKLKTKEGKSMMVDLGPADKLSPVPDEGDQVYVQGVPVKVKDRLVLMARKITQDGETKFISRVIVKRQ